MSSLFTSKKGIDLAGNIPTKGLAVKADTAISIAPNTTTTIVFNTVNTNDFGSLYYNASTGVFTAPAGGWYQFSTVVGIVGLAADIRAYTSLWINGANQHILGYATGVSTSEGNYMSGSVSLYLAEGDTAYVSVNHQNSTSLDTSFFTRMQILYIPAGFGSIHDATTSLDNTWSSQKVANEIDAGLDSRVKFLGSEYNGGNNTTVYINLPAGTVSGILFCSLSGNQSSGIFHVYYQNNIYDALLSMVAGGFTNGGTSDPGTGGDRIWLDRANARIAYKIASTYSRTISIYWMS